MKYVRKALLAGVFAALGVAGGLMADGDFTVAETIMSLGAGLVAGSVTYKVPNADKETAPGEAGIMAGE